MQKKESALDLAKFIDQSIRVKLSGGREVEGVLTGFDQLLNIVLDQTVEYVRDREDDYAITETKRELGLVICRGTTVVMVAPVDGFQATENPFVASLGEE